MALELVRNAERADLLAAIDLMGEALGFSFDGPATPDRIVEVEGAENFRIAVDRAGTARRGIVGVLSVQRAGQFFGSASHGMGGVRCVGVAPEHRGRGVLRAMLGDSLREQRAAGLPLSSLYPSSPRTYRSFGYEHAGANVIRMAALSGLAEPGPAPLAIEPVAPTEIDALAPVYARVAARTPGWLDRTAWWWQRALVKPLAAKKPRVYRFVRAGGGVEGYASLTHLLTDDHRLRLHVGELVCDGPDATKTVLSLLHSHRSMFKTMTWNGGLLDPLSTFFDVPVGEVYAEGAPLPAPINPWMMRVLSVRAFLEAWRFPRGLSVELPLSIRDALFPENAGDVRVRIEGGAARLEPGGEGTLKLDVRTLAALAGAHASISTLRAAGLVDGDDAALADLAAAFAGPPAWMWDAF
jgi:predicted acetyltransferase